MEISTPEESEDTDTQLKTKKQRATATDKLTTKTLRMETQVKKQMMKRKQAFPEMQNNGTPIESIPVHHLRRLSERFFPSAKNVRNYGVMSRIQGDHGVDFHVLSDDDPHNHNPGSIKTTGIPPKRMLGI